MNPLEYVLKPLKASKAERAKALQFIHQNPNYTPTLFELATNPNATRIRIYAAWVWELYILEEPQRLEPYWSMLIERISKINHSSMRRVHSKIIWWHLKYYSSHKALTKREKKMLVTTLLDWILTENKAAPLNFSIRTLGLFSRDSPKLKRDLKDILIESKRVFPKGVYPAIRMVFQD